MQYGIAEVHKTQALSIKHIVRGCLEGVFAVGQVYVLISRVTDPANFHLIGLPPKDLLPEVCAAWQRAGYDVVECLRLACDVTNEFKYVPDAGEHWADRLQPRFQSQTTVPVKHKEPFFPAECIYHPGFRHRSKLLGKRTFNVLRLIAGSQELFEILDPQPKAGVATLFLYFSG